MRVKKPNVVEVFTKAQLQELREKITSARDLALIFTGIECGCRVGEMRTIRASRIDWKERILVKIDSKKGVERRCGFTPWLKHQLQLYIDAFKPGDILFPMSPKRCEQLLQKWCKAIGIHDDENDPPKSWVSWHVVRRTYINQAGDAGIEEHEVQSVTGDTLSTIMRYYKKPNPGDAGKKMMKFYETG